MHIRRPVKSWKTSAAIFGGRRRLFWNILLCYMGRHRWGHTFFMKDMKRGMSCMVCRKRKKE